MDNEKFARSTAKLPEDAMIASVLNELNIRDKQIEEITKERNTWKSRYSRSRKEIQDG